MRISLIRPRPGPAAVVVGLIAGALYLNALGNGFAYDDVPIVVENEALGEVSYRSS